MYRVLIFVFTAAIVMGAPPTAIVIIPFWVWWLATTGARAEDLLRRRAAYDEQKRWEEFCKNGRTWSR